MRMTVVTRNLQAIEHAWRTLDAGSLGPAGAEHTGIKVIVLKREEPVGKGFRALGFDQHCQERPEPASDWVFYGDQGSGFIGPEQDSDTCYVDGIRCCYLRGFERLEVCKAEEIIWPTQRPRTLVAWQGALTCPRAGPAWET